MERTNNFLVFLVWFVLLNGCLLFEVEAVDLKLKAKAKLKLIHRHSPELGENTGTSLGTPKDSKERIEQLVHSDHARLQMISHRLGRKMDSPLNFDQLVELPMRSAADIGQGQYFVSVRVGTPTNKFLLLVDTGSTLTWMVCKYQCSDCWKDKFLRNERVFQPTQSTTFTPIPCSSTFCKTDLMGISTNICPDPQAPCLFDYKYLDGTSAKGFFGNDTLKIRLGDGEKVKMENVTLGCAESLTNAEKFQQIDGVLGMGYDTQSFAVKAAQEYGDKFSYCLVDHLSRVNLVNFLIFGGVGDSDNQVPNMQYTELTLGAMDPYYLLHVIGISINEKMLDIPSYVWKVNKLARTGGMILDSGATLTYMVEPMYDKVVSALLPFLSQYKKAQYEGLEHCFLNEGFNMTLIPRLAIHFADGAKFEPQAKSYVIDASPFEKCLGFRPLPWPDVSIIGNIMQENHLWEFDLLRQKLGFAPSSCTFD